jgi:hypothetical protein
MTSNLMTSPKKPSFWQGWIATLLSVSEALKHLPERDEPADPSDDRTVTRVRCSGCGR